MLLHGPLLLLALLFWVPCAEALPAGVKLVCPGVWFLLGDAHKGYSNTVVIEMARYLIVVDANYPGRAKELIATQRFKRARLRDPYRMSGGRR